MNAKENDPFCNLRVEVRKVIHFAFHLYLRLQFVSPEQIQSSNIHTIPIFEFVYSLYCCHIIVHYNLIVNSSTWHLYKAFISYVQIHAYVQRHNFPKFTHILYLKL